ncbi:PBSX family phage terminase large subunit [Halobacillus sp. A5]|uniref:PBSX family phage terminase large subunit n=1 Tax=Halobacillus sp. A5 TaxID=2880263 RepID=UPI0020A63931|nr:PBSX family phage terminase large subunit [Halobacillus sp. A5]MCP3026615.1 PBSX family phage terminase large subunit [Halobacillus sp. A5]
MIETMEAPKKLKPALFRFKPFSKKQKMILTWWHPKSPVQDKDGIICDGSVRAGKTVVMSLSYVMWGMDTFHEENLGLSGKTIGALRRNVITPLKRMLKSRGYRVKDHRADNYLTVSHRGHTNYFYIFGGKDESSQDLIQGITLAGMFFDEVALMPESFVSQAEARCSVDGSKYWYNCNPASPYHWFKEKYIDDLKTKNLIRLHFTMDDNPSLSARVINRYKRMFTGVFYKRFILGLWVLAEGIIYDMFSNEKGSGHIVDSIDRKYTDFYVSIDYGTQNPTTFGLWGKYQKTWYKVKEYFHDGRNAGKQKTDVEYSKDLKQFTKGIRVKAVIVDPSAASLIAQLEKDRFYVIKADNAVLDGIRNFQTALSEMMILYNDCCKETFREFSSYTWDKKASERGEDKPIKQFDHCLDSDRYFVQTILFAPKAGISGSNAW